VSRSTRSTSVVTRSDPPALESESALEAALPAFARVDAAALHDDGDLVRVLSGRPYASFNHVFHVRLAASSADGRIDAVHEGLRAARSVPATWWLGPSTRPFDLGQRLVGRGLRAEEPEFGMVIDLGSRRARFAAGLPAGVTIGELAPNAELDDWTTVMAGAYGWRDPDRAEAVRSLYRVASGEQPPWVHVVARDDGEPVACASLFLFGGLAFVTNVGTVPTARGRGLGSAATLAVLDVARQLGYERASLTASVMGRPMYARLGFREEARFDRFVFE
jgi:GNAT superfamily N-acetyltransferase